MSHQLHCQRIHAPEEVKNPPLPPVTIFTMLLIPGKLKWWVLCQISGAFRRAEIRCDWNLKKDQNRGKIWEKFSQVIDFTSLSSLLPRGKLKGRKR